MERLRVTPKRRVKQHVTVSGKVVDVSDRWIIFLDELGRTDAIPRDACLDGDIAEEGDTDLLVDEAWIEENWTGRQQ